MGTYIQSSDDFENYIQKILKDEAEKNCIAFLIIDKKNNKGAGSTSYGNIKIPDKKM